MYKTILVPVEGVERSQPVEQAALEIGEIFSSHIKGLRIIPTIESLHGIAEHHYLSYEVYEQILKNQEAEVDADRDAFVKTFDVPGISYEWVVEQGNYLHHLKRHARTCDLAIVPQGDDEFGDVMGDIPGFILDGGIPTLTVPKVRNETSFAQNIFILWNGGRESIRAIQGAMPLLKRAECVTVLSVAEEKKDEIVTANICKYLARHDVNVRGMIEELHFDPGAKLLEECLEQKADLIVSGAWAHTRLAELIYGGVTKTMFNNQQIPVLFAH